MAVLHDNTNRMQDLIADISALPPNQYETGLEEGYAKGYADGRSSLDVLSNLDFETVVDYFGKRLDSFGGQNLILLLTLKKGKTVPAGASFGLISKLASAPSQGATWIVNNGVYNTNLCHTVIIPSNYEWSMVGCYPGTQEMWDAVMDAFDMRLELINTEI